MKQNNAKVFMIEMYKCIRFYDTFVKNTGLKKSSGISHVKFHIWSLGTSIIINSKLSQIHIFIRQPSELKYTP